MGVAAQVRQRARQCGRLGAAVRESLRGASLVRARQAAGEPPVRQLEGELHHAYSRQERSGKGPGKVEGRGAAPRLLLPHLAQSRRALRASSRERPRPRRAARRRAPWPSRPRRSAPWRCRGRGPPPEEGGERPASSSRGGGVAAPKLSRRRLGRSAGSRRLNLSAELWRHVEAQPAWRRRSSRPPSPARLVLARLVLARLGQVRREGDHLRPVLRRVLEVEMWGDMGRYGERWGDLSVLRRVLEVDGRLSVGEDEQLELVVPPRLWGCRAAHTHASVRRGERRRGCASWAVRGCRAPSRRRRGTCGRARSARLARSRRVRGRAEPEGVMGWGGEGWGFEGWGLRGGGEGWRGRASAAIRERRVGDS